MKKLLIIFSSLILISVMQAYPQEMNQLLNAEKNSIPIQTNLNKTSSETTPADEPKKALMHYMGWFGGVNDGRHWEDGQPRKPLIGYYNSQSWATQMYHILLSWSCGIDGLVINVKDDYDKQSMKMLTPTLRELRDIDSTNFNYEFAVCYDDQGMENIDAAKNKFIFLRDSILPNNPSYLKYNDTAVIFIFNYNNPPYLTAIDYYSILNIVFKTNRPKLIWNGIDSTAIDYINTFYPWVQPDSEGWKLDGSNWGKGYLNWFYSTMANFHTHDFVIGGIWPGFDDRSCSWGKQRWISRQKGATYDSTWNFIKTYDFLEPTPNLPLKWVYIETWNDWNEGSEIEPSEVFGYKYLLSTIKNINSFKGTHISEDSRKFLAARKIYEAADLIEQFPYDSATYYPFLKTAIKNYILNQCDSALCKASHIIDSVPSFCNGTNSIEFKNGGFKIYPNPAKEKLYIRKMNNDPYSVQLTNIQGKVMLYHEGKKQLETFDVSQFPKGIYLIVLKQKDHITEGKIIVQ